MTDERDETMKARRVSDMTEEEVDVFLAELERDEHAYQLACVEVGNDDSIHVDDKLIAVCERIGHGDFLFAPVIHEDEMGSYWCDFCGVPVLMADKHVQWHRRIQAASKLASHVAEMALKHAMMTGWAIVQLAGPEPDVT